MFHHKLDIKPIPEDVLFINDTKLADRSTFKFGLLNSGKEKDEYFTRKAPVLRGGAPVAIRRRAPLNFDLIAVKLGNI